MITQYGPTEQARKEKLLWRENVKRKARKALKIASYASTCAIGLILFNLGMRIDYIQSPIVVRTQPVIVWREQTKQQNDNEIAKPTQVPAPTPSIPKQNQTKEEIVANSKFPKFIDHIWVRESTRGAAKDGLHRYCASHNQSNEFGFYPQSKWCWDTFEAGVRRLERWYEEDSAGLSENAKLCYYNTGRKVEDCAYLHYNFNEMN